MIFLADVSFSGGTPEAWFNTFSFGIRVRRLELYCIVINMALTISRLDIPVVCECNANRWTAVSYNN
jgi:hypothetical protein